MSGALWLGDLGLQDEGVSESLARLSIAGENAENKYIVQRGISITQQR